ncbi:Alpha/Beta hydrolase protein [Xylariales sp. PMI_506]|nr:Alpha/Beta hydrolase protein [Xylariales sp. PMI_506]
MLRKTTQTYATHGVALECDIYDADDYPTASSSPVFLFFHSGGLVGGARACVPPWLVQVCYKRKWPLISSSYRLLPQAGGDGLLEDASAAYEFARSWKAVEGSKRPVIVGGASAGFFLCALLAHHAQPAPAALLSITGITTFRHPFFSSSTLLVPEPISDADMAAYITAPVEASPAAPKGFDGTVFTVDRLLLPSGARDPGFTPPRPENPPGGGESGGEGGGWPRGCLYDYYLYNNAFPDLVGHVDLGFEWAKQDPLGEKLKAWPPTIFILGDEDVDVSPDLIHHTVDALGPKKTRLCTAKGQGHLFEAASYIEDETEAMNSVRNAVAFLDEHF